jgi:hypothetical protein
MELLKESQRDYSIYIRFFAFRRPHTPCPRKRVCLPPRVLGGSHTRLQGRGCGGPNSNGGTETLELYVYYNISTIEVNLYVDVY